ncbi:triose-phosphate isomerase [Gemmatimonadota bacterium]
MRRHIVAGNWKMHTLREEAANLARSIVPLVSDTFKADILVCPPFTALARVGKVLEGTGVFLGAQNMHHENKGAYTGEVSPVMLKDLGVSHVIVGHSERRQYFNESDSFLNLKVKTAIGAGLIPIYCVGETLEERESVATESVIAGQLEGGLEGVEIARGEDLVIAYEPIWAIGTGKTASQEQAQEVHAFIRAKLTQAFGADFAGTMRIQYGGSVKPDNAAALMGQPDIDGALVGGASLDAESFAAIVKSV